MKVDVVLMECEAAARRRGWKWKGTNRQEERPGVSDLNVPMGSKVNWEDLSASTGMGEEGELGRDHLLGD